MTKPKGLVYFLPVNTAYLSKWEYYQVDKDILESISDEVIVCQSFKEVAKNIFKAKAVYCWWWHQSCLVLLLAKLLKRRTYTTGAIHMFDISGAADYYKKPLAYRLAAKLGLFLSDFNLFISKDQYRQITSHLYVRGPMLLRSSLTKEDSKSLAEVLTVRSQIRKVRDDVNKFRFTTIVWHTPDQYKRKGVYETLEALSLLKSRTQLNFEWCIIGAEGPGFPSLKEKIKSFQLEGQVIFCSDISNEQKKEELLLSDLYVQPSWHEGFGNAVLEAMSCGVPALVSRYTAQPEVIGKYGLTVAEIEPEDIYSKMLEYMKLNDNEKHDWIQGMLGFLSTEFSFTKRLRGFTSIYEKSDTLLETSIVSEDANEL